MELAENFTLFLTSDISVRLSPFLISVIIEDARKCTIMAIIQMEHLLKVLNFLHRDATPVLLSLSLTIIFLLFSTTI